MQGHGETWCNGDCVWIDHQCESVPKRSIITSPNYPDNYPNGLHIQKAITVDEGYVVRISLKDLSLDHSSAYVTDYLEIKDGDGTLLRFFSNQAYYNLDYFASHIVSHTETVFLILDTEQGWKIEWGK